MVLKPNMTMMNVHLSTINQITEISHCDMIVSTSPSQIVGNLPHCKKLTDDYGLQLNKAFKIYSTLSLIGYWLFLPLKYDIIFVKTCSTLLLPLCACTISFSAS